MYGKKFEGVIRSSFLIDENGKIHRDLVQDQSQATVPEALKVLKK